MLTSKYSKVYNLKIAKGSVDFNYSRDSVTFSKMSKTTSSVA